MVCVSEPQVAWCSLCPKAVLYFSPSRLSRPVPYFHLALYFLTTSHFEESGKYVIKKGSNPPPPPLVPSSLEWKFSAVSALCPLGCLTTIQSLVTSTAVWRYLVTWVSDLGSVYLWHSLLQGPWVGHPSAWPYVSSVCPCIPVCMLANLSANSTPSFPHPQMIFSESGFPSTAYCVVLGEIIIITQLS